MLVPSPEDPQAPNHYSPFMVLPMPHIWDSRRLMHQGVPFDMTLPRRMWHTRIAGDPKSELALNYSDPSPVNADKPVFG